MKIEITEQLTNSPYYGASYGDLVGSGFVHHVMEKTGMTPFKSHSIYKEKDSAKVFLDQNDKYISRHIGDEFEGEY